MTLETRFLEADFTMWILTQAPDIFIEILSAGKTNFNYNPINNRKQVKMHSALKKTKVSTIARNKKHIFEFQKMIKPMPVYEWAIIEDDIEKEDDHLVKINTQIRNLYAEKEVNDLQQLATQLYFVRSFKEAYNIYLENKEGSTVKATQKERSIIQNEEGPTSLELNNQLKN